MANGKGEFGVHLPLSHTQNQPLGPPLAHFPPQPPAPAPAPSLLHLFLPSLVFEPRLCSPRDALLVHARSLGAAGDAKRLHATDLAADPVGSLGRGIRRRSSRRCGLLARRLVARLPFDPHARPLANRDAVITVGRFSTSSWRRRVAMAPWMRIRIQRGGLLAAAPLVPERLDRAQLRLQVLGPAGKHDGARGAANLGVDAAGLGFGCVVQSGRAAIECAAATVAAAGAAVGGVLIGSWRRKVGRRAWRHGRWGGYWRGR
ncbi:uncharacterized protein J3D65DRAFT_633097 [Phyllosticta citribraziliensis]|uniref:Uncharacterized protein n=1 Tax=Phyllosticta citribraziliensis TaxID=989973 RepID=A0ABR1LGJ1_9PEZI